MIDLIYSNITQIYESGTLNVNITDHFSTFLVKKKLRVKKKCVEIRGRSYKNLDWDTI